VIQEIWDKAVGAAEAVGGDSNKIYVEMLESKIETVTVMRDAALMKTNDLLMTCKASTFFVDESDPSWGLYKNLHKLVMSILSTSEQEVAKDLMRQRASMKEFRVRIIMFLEKSGVDGARSFTDGEIVKALEKLVDEKEADNGKDAEEPSEAAGE